MHETEGGSLSHMGFGLGISLSQNFLSRGFVTIFSVSSYKLKSYNGPCIRKHEAWLWFPVMWIQGVERVG